MKWTFYYVTIILIVGSILFNLDYSHFRKENFIIVSDQYHKTKEFPQLLLKAKSLPTFGYTQKKLKLFKVSDDFIKKLYPELKKALSDEEQKCLQPSSKNAHVTLRGYLASPLNVISGQRFNFQVNGIFKEIRIKKYGSFSVEETWYEAAVASPQLLNSFKVILHPEILHISIAVSQKIIGSSACFR